MNTIVIRSCFIFCLIAFFHFFGVSQTKSVKTPKVGLVLSGGGAKGLSHVGILKVLDEIGIKPDYIAGTSMGSIVGGLYAAGYSAHAIDSIIKAQDWDELLTDKVSRKNLTIDDKADLDKYFITFSFNERKIVLPEGIKAGQNISNLLSLLLCHVSNVTDFQKLPTPFICNGTDIENAQNVILKSGYLPECIRASMSIPTIFDPVEIDGKLLVDGGLCENFMAEELKKMGADIIIGVYVGYKPYSKDELSSIPKVLEQIIFIHGSTNTEINRELCDILIEPELKPYNASSFKNADSLIARGERAARLKYTELSHLADSLKLLKCTTVTNKVNLSDSIFIDSIEIIGAEKYATRILKQRLHLEEQTKLSLQELNDAIERLYGSQQFYKITYRLQGNADNTKLVINVNENTNHLFKVGIHYDSDFNASILLNGTISDFLFKGLRFSGDLKLGENPSLLSKIYIMTPWKMDVGMEYLARKFLFYSYQDRSRTGIYKYMQSTSDFFLQKVIKNAFAFRIGLQSEFDFVKAEISPYSWTKIDYKLLNLYGQLNIDTYEKSFYARKGFQFFSEFKLIKDLDSDNSSLFFQSTFLNLRYNQAISFGNQFTLVTGIHFGFSAGDTIPLTYQFYLGGMYENPMNGLVSFPGLYLMQETNRSMLAFKLNLQFEFARNHYLILKSHVGKLADLPENIFNFNHTHTGMALTYGYLSKIGPIEISCSAADQISWNSFMWYFNVGFWF